MVLNYRTWELLLVTSSFLLGCSNLLLHRHDLLAFLSVAILRAIPVNLLAVAAAVAIRLTTLAELASIDIQGDAADFASLPQGPQGGLDIRNIVCECIERLRVSPGRNNNPKLCLRKSI